MSEHDNAERARGLIDAWNVRDMARYRALLGAGCRVEGSLDEIPDMWFEITDVAVSGDTAVVSWHARGTAWRDVSDGGTYRSPIEARGFTVAGFRGREIVRLWHYWGDEEERTDALSTTAATAIRGDRMASDDARAWRTAPASAPKP